MNARILAVSLRPALLAALLAGCAGGSIWSASPRPWPVTRDGRVRRDGALLRVFGASTESPQAAAQDALAALRRYLAGLDLSGEREERAQKIAAVLSLARPQPAPVPAGAAHAPLGYAAIVELELGSLQRLLGTRYD